jgi:ADP-ribose pyrophosphatase YjhB (NUDIX family)
MTPPRLRQWVIRRTTQSYRLGVHLAVLDPAGQVLLVRHPYRERWGLPGGAVGRHEHYRDAAARELREEIGVAIDLSQHRFDTVQSVRSKWVTWVTRIDLPEVTAAAVRPTSAEISDIRWVNWDSLPPVEPIVDLVRTMVVKSQWLGL